jgi:two-component system chemotaxis response regulator CheY
MAKKILTVDDSRTMLETIRITLEKEGYDVDTASSGSEALGLLEGNRYSVIFADYNMPEMDGITLTKKIRSTASHRMVPVIMVTTESKSDRKNEGRSAGVTGWMVKPFLPDQLISVVEKVT